MRPLPRIAFPSNSIRSKLTDRCRQFLTGSVAFVNLEANHRRRLGRRPGLRNFLCQLLISARVDDAALYRPLIIFLEMKGRGSSGQSEELLRRLRQ